MEICVLSSGSCGNATFVSNGNTRLLVDAGLSGSKIVSLLEEIDRSIEAVSAILVTHAHGDHIQGVGVLSRKFDIPIYATNLTLAELSRIVSKRSLENVACFNSSDRFSIGDFDIQSIPIPHDTRDPVSFVLESSGKRLGIFTDIGYAFDGLGEILSGVDAALLETNHDLEMLANGPYSHRLKKRVGGRYGHLSNEEAVRLLKDYPSDRLRTVFLSHLSAENNHPERIRETIYSILGPNAKNGTRFILTNRGFPTPLISI